MEDEKEKIAGQYLRMQAKRLLFVGVLAVLIILLAVGSTIIGSAGLTVGEVFAAVLARLVPGSFSADPLASTIVWDLRLHRVLFAVVAGFGLAIAGAVMQGVLRNPLASPFTLGIASAATFGAAIAIIFVPTALSGEIALVVSAFVMSALAAISIYGLSRYRG
ncbi:MAG TPA: iron chelate uptake ABC transporter family permease subunit, partial [Methanolinea sp.]|nr:iron chelate uptake ABC transporter family permease subunit [Methanolinea sp.]